MEGVMMRNGNVYGLAVRQPDGVICAQRFPWLAWHHIAFLRLPLVRGFTSLIETIINGIHALNRSAEIIGEEKGGFAISALLAVLMAVGLFIAAPHLLSLLMHRAGMGGDVEMLSFHIWDGFYKCAIFIAYIWLIGLVPDIRRVYEYHGAEHKVVRAWETGVALESGKAISFSRLHPRCGTTFLLFVILISILLQAILIPLLLSFWTPANLFLKHFYTLSFKLLLIIPVSAFAYEMIALASAMKPGPLAWLLIAPGLLIQRLTTREPDKLQLEVALVALAVTLAPEDAGIVHTEDYCRLDSGFDI